MAEPQPQGARMLPVLPNITTTISSILSSPVQPVENEKTAPAQKDGFLASPLSAYIPSTGLSWFRRPSASKASSKSAGNSPRSPEKNMLSSLNEAVGEDGTPRASSDNGSQGEKRKRAPRPKTSYSICHAPPRHTRHHKIQVRARPLLQLHKLESRSRPRPAYELLPSAIFSTRLIKAIAKFSGSKHGLSPNDLAIVKAERYHLHETSPIEEDESRDILALICGITKGHNASSKVKICLEGGVEWDAYQLPTGSYEFTTVDAHGLKKTARWVPKRFPKNALTSPTSIASPMSPSIASPIEASERKFNFSTISANTRRHPIIAHLTATSLDVSDNYVLPTPSTSVDIPAPTLNRTSSDDTTASTDETLTTTDDLRSLIAATAIYVALTEGWCTSHPRSSSTGDDLSLTRSFTARSCSPSKPPSSPARRSRPESLDTEGIRRSSSLRQALRSPTLKRPGSSSSSLGVPEEKAAAMPGIPEAVSPVASRRRRADTTSTVIVTDGMRGSWRPAFEDETDDEEEVHGEEAKEDEKRGSVASERRSGSSERKRNFSESTAGGSEVSGSSEGTVEREKKGARETVESKGEKKEKKKGLLSKLLCGMV